MVSALILLTFLGNDQCWGLGGDIFPTLEKGHLEATTLWVSNAHESHSPARGSASTPALWEGESDSQASSSGRERVGK